jgi:hypothetical protein
MVIAERNIYKRHCHYAMQMLKIRLLNPRKPGKSSVLAVEAFLIIKDIYVLYEIEP